MILKKITSSSLVQGKFVLLHFLPPGNMSYLSYISTNLNFISGTLQDRSSETKEGDGLWDLAPWLHWPLGSLSWELVWEWTQTDYANIESSDDEQTSYDLATRAGTQVEPEPILDRVVMSTITPSYLFQLGIHVNYSMWSMPIIV